MKKLLFFTVIFVLFLAKVVEAQTESTYNNITINYDVDKSAGIDIGLSYVYLFTNDEISKVWGFLKNTNESVRYDVWDSKYIEKRISYGSNITLSYTEEWRPDWGKENQTGIKHYKYFASDYMITLIYKSEEYIIRFYPDKSLVFLFRQQKNGGYFYNHTFGVDAYNSLISNSNIKILRERIPLDILEKLKDVILTGIANK